MEARDTGSPSECSTAERISLTRMSDRASVMTWTMALLTLPNLRRPSGWVRGAPASVSAVYAALTCETLE